MINVVIPMAGLGSRFVKAGYKQPKPLIEVLGKPMIRLVIDNIRPSTAHQFIFIVQEQHCKDHELDKLLRLWSPSCRIISITKPTEGAACSVLLAKEFIFNSQSLLIANCDQFIEPHIDLFFASMRPDMDGSIMTMHASDAKWSYARTDVDDVVVEVREKEVISPHATVGLYLFRHGAAFVEAAEKMIAANERVNGEFYVAPTYNYMIQEGKKIGRFDIGSLGKGMHGLGTPEDLQAFLALPAARSLLRA